MRAVVVGTTSRDVEAIIILIEEGMLIVKKLVKSKEIFAARRLSNNGSSQFCYSDVFALGGLKNCDNVMALKLLALCCFEKPC